MKKGENTYKNKEWLEEHCCVLRESDKKIAQYLGIHKCTVKCWRDVFGINKTLKKRPSEDELRHLYLVEKKSDQEIADMYCLSQSTACRIRMKYGIEGRSISEANHVREGNHVDLSEEAKDLIYGELLGDGHLAITSKYSAKYEHSSKYREYVQWLSKRFKSFGIEQSGKIYQDDCGLATTYSYSSKSYPELLTIRQEWYPFGEKIIPRYLKITPLVMLHHYLGDGTLYHHNMPHGNSSITLCTNGFMKDDVFFLMELLSQKDIKTNRHKSNNTIYIPVAETPKFFSYIGECPDGVKGIYGYKWDTTMLMKEWIEKVRPSIMHSVQCEAI